MADYYPLISRAVAGLEKNNGENRRALYERARAALLAQLRGVSPSLNESDITRERLALEESIRKVEAEAARQFVDPGRQPPVPKIKPIDPPPPPPEPKRTELRRRSADEADAPPPRRYVNPPSPGAPEARQDSARRSRPQPAPPALPDQRQSDTIFDQPLPSSDQPPPASPPRHPLRRPVGERRPLLSDSGLKDFRNVVSEANELGGASARAEKSARDAYAAVPAPPADRDRPQRSPDRSPPDRSPPGERQQIDRYERPRYDRAEPRMFEQHTPQERMFEPQPEPRPHDDFSEPMLEPAYGLEDERPPPPKGRRPPPAPIDDAEYEAADEDMRPRRSFGHLIKPIIAALALLLIAGLAVWQWPNMVSLYRALRPAASDVARETSSPSSPKKTQERIEPGSQQSQSTPAPAPGAGGAAVAQKVVLYEEDPADPNGKRFVGSAIWRTETVTPGPGQPPELAVRADVEVPERKLTMTWSFRRNTDKSLPASHTVEIMFKLPPDFPAGGISNVPGILMKQAESTRGTPLAGLAVKVTDGFYLIGLSSVDADRERNMQLLKERGWFDIPVVYSNNRRAILAMEKGTPGERAFAEAFKAWKQ